MSGFLSGLLSKPAVTETRAKWWEVLDIPRTHAGVSVTMDKALTMSAVFDCVRILAEDVAKLPLHVYKRRKDRGKDRATDHPLYSVLHDNPNDEMTSFSWREGQQAWLGSWGNAYSTIRTDYRGRVRELWPLRSEWMKVKREQGNLVYEYRVDGTQPEDLPASQVLHLHGFGFDGIQGYSPIRLARQGIGLGLAAEEFGGRFFGNDARPGIVLEHPGQLSDQAYQRLKGESEKFSGVANAYKPRVLEEGLKLHEIGVPPEDAQFLQTRKFQVEEVARWYRMPLHKISSLDQATNNNIEQQAIEYVIDTLMPWLSRWEQVLTARLLTDRERRQGYFVAFLVDGLLRGDMKTRYESYALGRQWGWFSANDILTMENRNPIPDGDQYMVPLNMVPANLAESVLNPVQNDDRSALLASGYQHEAERHAWNAEKRTKQTAGYRQKLMNAHQPVFRDAAGRAVRAEVREIRKQAQKVIGRYPLSEFIEWLNLYYENHAQFTKNQFLPVLMAYAELVAEAVAQEGHPVEAQENIERFMDVYAQGIGTRHSGRNLYTLQSKIEQAQAGELDPLAVIEETLDAWLETQPEAMAREETTRSNNALAVMLYGMAGVLTLRWAAIGESCPYCANLDARVIGIQEYFLAAGDQFQPEGAEKPLSVNKSKRHPPAHSGCDCVVLAG